MMGRAFRRLQLHQTAGFTSDDVNEVVSPAWHFDFFYTAIDFKMIILSLSPMERDSRSSAVSS